MPGHWITDQQDNIYMNARTNGQTQIVSAAKSGFSERSGRTLERQVNKKRARKPRGRTRPDPLKDVWSNTLVPLLEESPDLSALTLLEYLQDTFEGQYPDKLLRTVQRRVKEWRALYGPKKMVMFRQEHPPGRLGLSDFTTLKDVTILIAGEPLKHILYHFRLSCSHWSHVKVILGGESYTALTEGLQEALWRLGGSPTLHRTDSLSAAFKNLTRDEQKDITERYKQFCQHYGMEATRNNLGESHENGSVEAPHGHVKRRIKQALLLRGNNDFESVDSYQFWLDGVINQHNRRNAKSLQIELPHLNPLPLNKAVDFTEVCARVSSSATIDVRRATYTVPSRLEGENLRVHLYHDRLECFLGAIQVITLARVYPIGKTARARNIDYRHVIHSLVKKPQAFRFSQIRDDLLPSTDYKTIWHFIDRRHGGVPACKLMVGLLFLAAEHDCEVALADAVLSLVDQNKAIHLLSLQHRFSKSAPPKPPKVIVLQHELAKYDVYLTAQQEVCYA
jgi:hypothetical protein